MTYLYIDESGDLGFSSRGSNYFLITCVKIGDEKINITFKRIPRKVRRELFGRKAQKETELKFSNTSEKTKKSFLAKAAKIEMEVFCLIIKKEHTKNTLRENLPVLYNYLIKVLLEKVLPQINRNRTLMIFLDKSMSSTQRNNFESYIKTEFFSIFNEVPRIEIIHENSMANEGIQVTDFICGAFGYKYNTRNLGLDCERYTKIICEKIKLEKNDLFKKE
ncbi:MAG TPA: DUF3800 domain-containing protein [archaeon]|nr:DUF3800 domain-containing protein [archaeon]